MSLYGSSYLRSAIASTCISYSSCNVPMMARTGWPEWRAHFLPRVSNVPRYGIRTSLWTLYSVSVCTTLRSAIETKPLEAEMQLPKPQITNPAISHISHFCSSPIITQYFPKIRPTLIFPYNHSDVREHKFFWFSCVFPCQHNYTNAGCLPATFHTSDTVLMASPN
jgi:hypothetical protein